MVTLPMLHVCHLWDRPYTLNGLSALSSLGRSQVAIGTPNHAGIVESPWHPHLPAQCHANLGTD